jgi:hypothetical protein
MAGHHVAAILQAWRRVTVPTLQAGRVPERLLANSHEASWRILGATWRRSAGSPTLPDHDQKGLTL